jgi:hypothetical protein
MASEPAPPVEGNPTFGPGWLEITALPALPLPPLVGGAAGELTFSGAPNPAPVRPLPEPVAAAPPPSDGGGGTTFLASNVPRGAPAPPPVVPEPPPAPESCGGGGTTLAGPMAGAAADARVRAPAFDIPAEGGGAITFEPSAAPEPLRVPRGFPPPELAATDGGGGTTAGATDVPEEVPLPRWLLDSTDGGGGTTSLAPKIFPIRLLTNDPLPDCVGGGGTTEREGSGTLPLASRRISCDISCDGGGAITEGEGKVTFEIRDVARSGADAGGGTTDTFDICTGELEISRLTPPGAGGITLAESAGAARVLSRDAFGAGATTVEFKDGAVSA